MTSNRLTLVVVDETSVTDLPISDGPWHSISSVDEATALDLGPDDVAVVDDRECTDLLACVAHLVDHGRQRRTVVLSAHAGTLLRHANEQGWKVEIVLGYATPVTPA